MNLHLLRMFDAVMQHGSFSGAAAALAVSQPAVSRGVRELEAQLGCPLLDRGPGGVRPTEAGQVLIGHARAIFAAEQAAVEALGAIRGLDRGTLRIGASTTIATYLLPPLLGRFHAAHPQVELRLTSANTAVVADLLRERRLDVALVEGPIEAADIVVTPWQDDDLVLVAAPTHPLARRRRPIPRAVLASETLVLREEGSGTREVAVRALDDAGVTPARILEVGGNEAITRVVAAGLGIGIVSAAVAADPIALGRIRSLTVEGLHIRRRLTRLTLRDRPPSPAAAAFERLLDAAAGPPPAGRVGRDGAAPRRRRPRGIAAG